MLLLEGRVDYSYSIRISGTRNLAEPPEGGPRREGGARVPASSPVNAHRAPSAPTGSLRGLVGPRAKPKTKHAAGLSPTVHFGLCSAFAESDSGSPAPVA